MPARAAGRCRVTIGDLEVTFLPDGFICTSPESSYPGSPEALWRANPHLLDGEGRFVMSLGALLVRSGERRVLVDLGWGPTQSEIVDPSSGAIDGRIVGGALLGHLAACGVRPEDVDTVLFSHLHRDHTGWLDHDGAPCFPNADHLVAEAEWAYWTTAVDVGVGPAPTREQLEVLATRVGFVVDGDTPVPGVDVLATPGHTPGHCSFVPSSGSARALVLGDAVHCPLELLEPELGFVADVDPALAQRTKRQIEAELLRAGTVAVGPHFADLVFGRLLPGDGRPSWHFPATQRSIDGVGPPAGKSEDDDA
ncbi:MAG: MBL fold metallo-hydrolase [Acidimicrobiales bacterium]